MSPAKTFLYRSVLGTVIGTIAFGCVASPLLGQQPPTPAEVAKIRTELRSGDFRRVNDALIEVQIMQGDGKVFIPDMVAVIKGDPKAMPFLVFRVMGEVGGTAELVKLLNSDNPKIKINAALGLTFAGRSAMPFANSIALLAKDSDGVVRGAGAAALARADPDHPGVVPGLIAAVGDSKVGPNTVVRLIILQAIAALGPKAKDVVPALVKAVNPDDPVTGPILVYYAEALNGISTEPALRSLERMVHVASWRCVEIAIGGQTGGLEPLDNPVFKQYQIFINYYAREVQSKIDKLPPDPTNRGNSGVKLNDGEKVCNYCNGWGKKSCHICYGSRKENCYSCGGRGYTGSGDLQRECTSCHGLKKQNCFACTGRGEKDCPDCRGSGKVQK